MQLISQTTKYNELLKNNAVRVILGTLGLALSANISIDAVVPMSIQSFGVMLLAFVLPRKQALQALGLYIAAGAAGLPIFAAYCSGFAILFGGTCGYFVGFIACVYLIGTLRQHFSAQKLWQVIAYSIVGTIAIFVGGVTWLTYLIGFTKAITFGVTPFLLSALLKILLVAATVKAINVCKNT